MLNLKITKNYLRERGRMTKGCNAGRNCPNCSLNPSNNKTGLPCEEFEAVYPEKAVAIVQKWSDEHPPKTYLSEFLKNYPNAELDENGIPKICLWRLGLTDKKNCRESDCIKCWNQVTPIEDGEENV